MTSPRPLPRILAALLLTASLVSACAPGGGQTPSGGASPASPSGSGDLVGNATESPPPPGPGEFVNPVLDTDFPDPFVMKVGNTYWAYATEGNAKHIQVARSNDLVSWEQLGDALPDLPAFSLGKTWAPEVAKTSAGYVLYYTLAAAEFSTPRSAIAQCISFAVSATPQGPFVDSNTKPFVCQPDLGGSIDATPFRDTNGKRYLIWKNDGNCCAIPTRFYMQELTADGRKLVGSPKELGLEDDAPWERLIRSGIESPELLLHDGTYYVFFSASAFDTEFYGVGYATSKTVTGPYVDAPENPILKTRDPAFGPGHPTITQSPDGRLWFLYAAWGPEHTFRSLWLNELVFENGKPVIKGPDVGPLPAPGSSPGAPSSPGAA
jgi:beta-xylosidase